MQLPLVSAVIPVHDAEASIDRALASVASQTYPRIEIVVVDDASRDGSVDIVRRWKTRADLTLIIQPRNSGPSAARNAGLAAARGDYIAFLDSDDEWCPEKTSKQVRIMEDDPSVTLCAADEVWLYPDGSMEVSDEGRSPENSGPHAWKTFLARASVHTSSVMVRRDLALSVGGFDESLRVGEDQDLWIRLAHCGSVRWIAGPAVRVHNRRDGYMSANADREAHDLLSMVQAHLIRYRQELTARDRRSILGCRFSRIGRNLCNRGAPGQGRLLILRAIGSGYSPAQNLAFLTASSAPGRWVKRRIHDSIRIRTFFGKAE